MISNNRVMRYFRLGLGMLALSLGTAGILLPLLPTVPFYLLAAFCFAKSSERVHAWFKSTKGYAKYVAPFQDKRGIPLRLKFRIIAMVTAVMSFSGYLMAGSRKALLVLALVWLVQCIVLLFFVKTRKELVQRAK